eukprot:TRINITY_DN5118_c0_g2_i1.p2 TRINITY_DN5118_c0_g2~~TRINITY_DN5118_c0_g2_i1.p2  ORF type:complete len:409 (+),score=169.98 TRINITY_DN5118_c0_g2_i1:79-1305(+)
MAGSSRVFDLQDGSALYECLGVPREATEDEIKKAFRKLAIIHHPDKNPADGGERFREMSFAYKILSNPEDRKTYDDKRLRATLGPGGTNPEMDPNVELEGEQLRSFVNLLCKEEEESKARRRQFEDKKRAEIERRAKFDRENPHFKMPTVYGSNSASAGGMSARRLSSGTQQPPAAHANPHSDFLRNYADPPRPQYTGSAASSVSTPTNPPPRQPSYTASPGEKAYATAPPVSVLKKDYEAGGDARLRGDTASDAAPAGRTREREGKEVKFDPALGRDGSSHSSTRSAGSGRTSPQLKGAIFGNGGTPDYGLWGGGGVPVHKSTPPNTSTSTNPRRPRPTQHSYVSAPASFLVNGGRPDGKPPYDYDVGNLHKRTQGFNYRSYVEEKKGSELIVDAILSDALKGYSKP